MLQLPSPVRAAFRAAAESFVPDLVSAPPERWAALEQIIGDALLQRPLRLRRQVFLLIRLLDLVTLLRWGRRLAALDAGRRRAWLERLGTGPIPLLRHGIWGLRTLVMMGWYGQAQVQSALGYRASPQGWGARG